MSPGTWEGREHWGLGPQLRGCLASLQPGTSWVAEPLPFGLGQGRPPQMVGHIVEADSCCTSQSGRTELGTTFGIPCLIIGAPTSNSLPLGLSIPTCPQRTQWFPQAGGGSFLPWSVPDGQVGASCCGYSGCKGQQTPDALCDDGRGLRPAGWR